MTIQEVINKLNEIDDKNLELKLISNQTMEDYIVVDMIRDRNSLTFYLEIE